MQRTVKENYVVMPMPADLRDMPTKISDAHEWMQSSRGSKIPLKVICMRCNAMEEVSEGWESAADCIPHSVFVHSGW